MRPSTRLSIAALGGAVMCLAAATAIGAILVPAPSAAPPAEPEPTEHRRVDPRGCCELDPGMRCGPYEDYDEDWVPSPAAAAPPVQTSRKPAVKRDVLSAVKEGLGPIEACLARHTPDATVSVRWFIGKAGAPTDIEVLQAVSPDVATCLTKTVGALRFPRHESLLGVPITFPFRAGIAPRASTKAGNPVTR